MTTTATAPAFPLQEQYTAFAKQGQAAAVAAVDAWTRAVQETAVRVPTAAVEAATTQAVDQAFDFVVSLIDVQRGVAKQFTGTTVEAAAQALEQVTRTVSDAITKAGEVLSTEA